ncbi:VOC family protein [Peribacillus saganii]|uniref:VOC family protein n=1 Tax=Peribacillus saganii TaxID=2303992 RepID=A0A372LJZ1_9BACI|nr:VOC family protein [Peribacillus saganii]RFU66334.1 VOC family protein [Peribacillus saganii]
MKFQSYPNTFVSHVSLIVTDIKRSLSYYKDIIGFQVLNETSQKAILTADGITPLLTIEQPENVSAKQQRTTGLYHFALLLPNRSDLGSVLYHFLQIGYPLQGASDHLVSEAIYLADPDGNGIEIYADRPSNTWKWENGQVSMTTERLDAESLLAEGQGKTWKGLPKETVMGHIHLHVSELKKTEEFYCKGLGFDVVTRYGGQALFISTGSYHHHIGLNTWNGIGAPTPNENSVGLRWFSLVLPNEAKRLEVTEQLQKIGASVDNENGTWITRDPSGNTIHLLVI